MNKLFTEFSTNAMLRIGDLSLFEATGLKGSQDFYSFVWSHDDAVFLEIDGVPTQIEPHHIVALTPIQQVRITSEGNATVYQFNREFYCIQDHDKEVSCMGLLFFGADSIPIVALDAVEQGKYDMLHQVFLEELDTKDTIQAEMLRMLLARFIIKTTRLLKLGSEPVADKHHHLELFRSFNILVETHFKEAHNVSFYAEKLFKSPKTLSNQFAKLSKRPLQIIHERIVLEAQRQLSYTNKTAKQIAFDIGFEDPSHLSRMFKRQTSLSISDYRKSLKAS